MEPVALCTREITRSAIFRRDCARAWWHVTLVWSLQCLATNNCKTEKKSREWTTKKFISLIPLISLSFLLDYKKWEDASLLLFYFLLNSTTKTCQKKTEVLWSLHECLTKYQLLHETAKEIKVDHDSENYHGRGLFYQQRPKTEAVTQTKENHKPRPC